MFAFKFSANWGCVDNELKRYVVTTEGLYHAKGSTLGSCVSGKNKGLRSELRLHARGEKHSQHGPLDITILPTQATAKCYSGGALYTFKRSELGAS